MGPVVEPHGDDLARQHGRQQRHALERRLADQADAVLPRGPVEKLDDTVDEPAEVLAVAGGDAPERSMRRQPHSSDRSSMPYSMESTRASQLASMMFWLTPMLPQLSSPSLASSNTRVAAPVPLFSSRMRTR